MFLDHTLGIAELMHCQSELYSGKIPESLVCLMQQEAWDYTVQVCTVPK